MSSAFLSYILKKFNDLFQKYIFHSSCCLHHLVLSRTGKQTPMCGVGRGYQWESEKAFSRIILALDAYPPYLFSQRLSLPPLVCSTCPFPHSPFPSASTYTLLPLLATCGLVKHPAHCVVGKWPPPHTCRPVDWPRRELATGQLNKHFWGLASRRSISGQEGLLSAAACWDLGVLQPHLQDSLSGLLGGGRGGSDYSPACPPGLASWVRKGKEARLHGFQGDLAWESSRCRKPWKWLPFSIPRIQALCFHSDQEGYVFP